MSLRNASALKPSAKRLSVTPPEDPAPRLTKRIKLRPPTKEDSSNPTTPINGHNSVHVVNNGMNGDFSRSLPMKRALPPAATKTAKSRLFVCSFSHYGCESTFASKNEWKRHITNQHLQLGFYRCDVGACKVEKVSTRKSGNQPNPNDFNRKDLFTQHHRRMHPPWAPAQKAPSQRANEDFEASLEAVRERCWTVRRQPPTRSSCGFCGQMFAETENCWDERMEHVGKHYEKRDNLDRGMLEAPDEELRDWAINESLIVKDDEGHYVLVGYEPSGKQPIAPRSRPQDRVKPITSRPSFPSNESEEESQTESSAGTPTLPKIAAAVGGRHEVQPPQGSPSLYYQSQSNGYDLRPPRREQGNQTMNLSPLQHERRVSLAGQESAFENSSSYQVIAPQPGRNEFVDGYRPQAYSANQNHSSAVPQQPHYDFDFSSLENALFDLEGKRIVVSLTHIILELYTTDLRLRAANTGYSDGLTTQRTSIQFFACPYSKYDRDRYSLSNPEEVIYRKCGSACLEGTARLKEHIFRSHTRPDVYCVRCNATFASHSELKTHIKSNHCNDEVCPWREKLSSEYITALKTRHVGELPASFWYRVFHTLFPQYSTPSSPYVDESTSLLLQDFLIFRGKMYASTLSQIMQERFGQHISFEGEDQIVLEEAMEQTMHILVDRVMEATKASDPRATPQALQDSGLLRPATVPPSHSANASGRRHSEPLVSGNKTEDNPETEDAAKESLEREGSIAGGRLSERQWPWYDRPLNVNIDWHAWENYAISVLRLRTNLPHRSSPSGYNQQSQAMHRPGETYNRAMNAFAQSPQSPRSGHTAPHQQYTMHGLSQGMSAAPSVQAAQSSESLRSVSSSCRTVARKANQANRCTKCPFTARHPLELRNHQTTQHPPSSSAEQQMYPPQQPPQTANQSCPPPSPLQQIPSSYTQSELQRLSSGGITLECGSCKDRPSFTSHHDLYYHMTTYHPISQHHPLHGASTSHGQRAVTRPRAGSKRAREESES